MSCGNTDNEDARFEILWALLLKIKAFCDVKWCQMVNSSGSSNLRSGYSSKPVDPHTDRHSVASQKTWIFNSYNNNFNSHNFKNECVRVTAFQPLEWVWESGDRTPRIISLDAIVERDAPLCFGGVKAAGSWRWLLASIYCAG
jgi:hypothetical protein